jgi:hypothetical protein
MGGGAGGGDTHSMRMRAGGGGFRQNPPRKIQMISRGESQTITM